MKGVTEYPDGSMRIDSELVRASDETEFREALHQFYGREANIDPIVDQLKRDAEKHPTDLSLLLRPLGWERPARLDGDVEA